MHAASENERGLLRIQDWDRKVAEMMVEDSESVTHTSEMVIRMNSSWRASIYSSGEWLEMDTGSSIRIAGGRMD